MFEPQEISLTYEDKLFILFSAYIASGSGRPANIDDNLLFRKARYSLSTFEKLYKEKYGA